MPVHPVAAEKEANLITMSSDPQNTMADCGGDSHGGGGGHSLYSKLIITKEKGYSLEYGRRSLFHKANILRHSSGVL